MCAAYFVVVGTGGEQFYARSGRREKKISYKSGGEHGICFSRVEVLQRRSRVQDILGKVRFISPPPLSPSVAFSLGERGEGGRVVFCPLATKNRSESELCSACWNCC